MHRTNVSDVLAIRANAAEKLQLLSASTSQHYSTIRYLPLAYHSFPNYEVLIAYTIHTCALVSVCVSLSSCASMVENTDSHANGQWWRIPEIWISGWHDRRTENLAYMVLYTFKWVALVIYPDWSIRWFIGKVVATCPIYVTVEKRANLGFYFCSDRQGRDRREMNGWQMCHILCNTLHIIHI